MHQFNVEGVSVTDTAVQLHGVWDLGHTKRFQIVKVPISLFIAEQVLEALCEAHSARRTRQVEEWAQFLLWG